MRIFISRLGFVLVVLGVGLSADAESIQGHPSNSKFAAWVNM
jgi:hypothetical protein